MSSLCCLCRRITTRVSRVGLRCSSSQYHHLHTRSRAFTAVAAAANKVDVQLVKALREQSGAPVTECRDALQQAYTQQQTDESSSTAALLRAATDILRKKGIHTVSKKSSRRARDGVVCVSRSVDCRSASIIEINSETDFAARNERFQQMTLSISQAALRTLPTQLSSLLTSRLPGSENENTTVQDLVTETVSVLRENIYLRRAAALSTQQGGVIGVYVHGAVYADGESVPDSSLVKMGRSGTIAALSVNDNTPNAATLQPIANKLAMQITAAQPTYVSRSDVPADIVAHERSLLLEQARSSGKDDKHIQRIVEGRLNKFYAEHVLLEQRMVVVAVDEDEQNKPKKVSQWLQDECAAVGLKAVQVTGFMRYTVGEGIQQEQGMSFAEEVQSKLSK